MEIKMLIDVKRDESSCRFFIVIFIVHGVVVWCYSRMVDQLPLMSC